MPSSSLKILVSYLWIDSLCIIQGDKLDFEEECSRMHLIYLGCHVMIAASDARDGSDGLLPPHDNGGSQCLTTSELNPSKPRAFVPLSSGFRLNGYIEWTKWAEAVQGTLSKRGWTFQECELAPRILHYTHSGILWECRICIGAGDTDKLQPKRVSNILVDGIYSPDSRMFRTLDLDRSRLNHMYIMDRWLYIAEEYSTRHLTYQLDKLPALSGIAAAIASLLNYEPSVLPYPIYLAGLWVPDLCSQLFWTSVPPCASVQEARNALPSWSWASHPNPVNFHQIFNRLSVESTYYQQGLYHKRRSLFPHPSFSFVSTDITSAGSDLFGSIHGSVLNIRGSYLDIEVSKIIKQRWQPEYDNLWSFKHRLFHEAEQTYLWFDYVLVASQDVNLRFLILMQSDEWHVGIILRAESDGDGGGHDKKADAYEKIGIFGVFIGSRGHIGNKSHFNSGFKNPALDIGEMTLV